MPEAERPRKKEDSPAAFNIQTDALPAYFLTVIFLVAEKSPAVTYPNVISTLPTL